MTIIPRAWKEMAKQKEDARAAAKKTAMEMVKPGGEEDDEKEEENAYTEGKERI